MVAAPSCPSPPAVSLMTAAQSKGWGLSQLPPQAGIKCPPWLCSGARTIRGRRGLLGPGDSADRPTTWGIPWALLARASGPTRACRPTWAGERGVQSPSSSPNLPAAPPAPNLATSSTYSHSSHGGHAQWCWGMRGDQAEQGAAGGWTLDLGHGGILTPLPLALSAHHF